MNRVTYVKSDRDPKTGNPKKLKKEKPKKTSAVTKKVPYEGLAAGYEPNSEVIEAKVDQGLDDEAKEDARNYRKFGTKHNQAGTARFRRALHRSRRGEKKIKGVKESVTIEDAKGRPFLEIIDIIKPEPMKSPKNNIKFEEGYGKDKKVDKVKCAVENERKRKNALQIQKTIGTQ